MSLQSSARTALPTHDPASVPVQGAPEAPRALRAPPAAPPWLAPSTSIRAPGESTIRTRVRLPTVAESAELLGGGWTPVLGRLGVWSDEGGDSGGRWWTWALEIARRDAARDRSRARADEHGSGRVWWSRVAAGGASE